MKAKTILNIGLLKNKFAGCSLQFFANCQLATALFLFIACFLLPDFSSAQQLPFSSQYYMDPFVINPASTGTGENISAYLTHRSQWTGLAGAPQTSYLTLDGPAPTKNVGLGMKVYSDVTDMISRVGAFANYSYKLKIQTDHIVYFGLALGVLDTKIDFSKAVVKDADDPFLFQQPQNKTVFSADFGVVYMWQRLTVGFAVPQVLGNKVKYGFPDGESSYYNLSRHYQGSFKYEFDVVKEKGITAYPLIMLRGVKGAPFQYDVNAVVDWKKMGWAGLTYHSNYAIAISAGVRYHNFCVGYAYDIGVSKVRSYTGSTSEFLLGYIFAENKKGYVKTEEPENKDTLKSIVKVDSTAKAKADSIENNRLKTELAKTNNDSLKRNASVGGNDALLAQMKAISERYYEVVNQVDEALLAQMKVVADSNQAQNDRLKAELARLKASGASGSSDTSKHVYANDAFNAQLKAKSDSNQVQIDKLKARIAALEASKSIDNVMHAPSNAENDALLNKLKSKSDANQAQIDQLKAELAKSKVGGTVGGTTQTIVSNPAGGLLRTSESDDFADDKGKPVSTGFYVVIGTFGNKENVDKFKASNIMKGHVNTKVIQNHFTKVYNVFVLKTNNKADADAERAKYKVEYPDVWILKLE